MNFQPCGKVRLINPQAKSHLKGILPDRYADYKYEGKRSQKPLAFLVKIFLL